MALIVYYDSGGTPEFLCSGTLVSQNVVLTAGHCAVAEGTDTALDPADYRVVTGAVDWTNTAVRQVSGVSQVIVDPSFDPATLDNDAASLVLSAPVSATSIPLWTSGGLGAGTGAQIAGWGDTYAGEPFGDQTLLQWAPTVVQSIAYCSQEAALIGYDYDSATELCAVNPPAFDTGTCTGDSGGPLLAQDTAGNLIEIGLTSVGPSDCATQTADYFTAILPIASWVQAVIAAVAPPPPSPPPPPNPPPPARSPTPSSPAAGAVSATTTPNPVAGVYWGPTSQGWLVRLLVAQSREKLSWVTFTGVRVRCTRHAPMRWAIKALLPGHRGWTLNREDGLGFQHRFRDTSGGRYLITGTFPKPGAVVGTLAVWWQTPAYGTCKSGLIHWKAGH